MATEISTAESCVATSATTSSCFLVGVRGQLECAHMIDADSLYCRYSFHSGPDWQLINGMDEAISQVARREVAGGGGSGFVWNLPLEASFKSTSAFGWPQLIVSCFGADTFGNDILRGYGLTHIPLSSGHHQLRMALFAPSSASHMQRLMSWFTGRRPELVDLSVLSSGHGREVMRVESQGHVEVSVDVMLKDFHRLGYRNSCVR